jgi:hypothetical protein
MQCRFPKSIYFFNVPNGEIKRAMIGSVFATQNTQCGPRVFVFRFRLTGLLRFTVELAVDIELRA